MDKHTHPGGPLLIFLTPPPRGFLFNRSGSGSPSPPSFLSSPCVCLCSSSSSCLIFLETNYRALQEEEGKGEKKKRRGSSLGNVRPASALPRFHRGAPLFPKRLPLLICAISVRVLLSLAPPTTLPAPSLLCSTLLLNSALMFLQTAALKMSSEDRQ